MLIFAIEYSYSKTIKKLSNSEMSNSENTMNDSTPPPYPYANNQDPYGLPLPPKGIYLDTTSETASVLTDSSASTNNQSYYFSSVSDS